MRRAWTHALAPARRSWRSRPIVKAPLPIAPRDPTANRLLGLLPRKDRSRMIAGCEKVEHAASEVVFAAGERLRHAHFPISVLVTLATPIGRSTGLEVGLVGDEGMLETPLVLGIDVTPLQATVQRGGVSLRMGAAAFRRELGNRPALRRILERYLFVRMTQLAQAAGCTRYHDVEARLARWLLMTQDRTRSNAMHLTHEFLALMLGVRRAGVTQAAISLQKLGLISYRRGDILIVDRAGLEAAACACYATDRATYRRVLAPSATVA